MWHVISVALRWVSHKELCIVAHLLRSNNNSNGVCVWMCCTAAQYLYDRSKPQPLYSFGSPHGDVSSKIDEEEEEDVEAAVDGDDSDADSGLHNSSSQTSLIRHKLTADDNGNALFS